MQRKLIVLWLFLSCPVLSSQTVEDLGLSLEQLENKLFFLVNQERSSRGLPGLSFDPLLRDIARDHSQKMVFEKKLGHDFPGYEKLAERATQAGLYFSKIGENVASGNTFVMRFFHEQLLSSPEHRENILDREFSHLGIGIGLLGDMYYVTQEFASLFEPVSQHEVEREMEKKLEIMFNGNMVIPQASAAAIQDFCRQVASLFLQDKPFNKIPDSFGAASILTLNFIEMETAFARIKTETKDSKPIYWALGVVFGRSVKNPGGIYTLSLVMFSDPENCTVLSLPKKKGK